MIMFVLMTFKYKFVQLLNKHFHFELLKLFQNNVSANYYLNFKKFKRNLIKL